jgi:hypothetical protein
VSNTILKKSNLSYGTIGVAVAVVAMTLMVGSTPVLIAEAYAQPSVMSLGGSIGLMEPMNDETTRFIKDYLISVIENNLTS